MASGGAAHKALIKNSSKFKESGLDPRKLAVVLYKKELITPEAYAKTTDSKSTASDEEKLEILYNDIDENTLVKDGYFDRFMNCLMNDIKDERCTTVAQSIKSSYEDMVAQRQDITVGVKHRLSDTAKFMKKKAAQFHEGVRAFSYAVGDVIAKEKVEGSFEEDNDLEDTQNEQDESQNKEEAGSEDESPNAYRCLYCTKSITQEEEPVHRACLPDYPLCIRCLQNEKKDSSYYCEQCLKYEQVSICHCCSGETNGIPVHLSCLEKYPWCLRCMAQKRENTKYLCDECEPAYVCLHCLEPIDHHEEPVHKDCLPHYSLCIRCQTNKRSDPSNYCAHCLIYNQVYTCQYCSSPTNGSPVHFSCLKHYTSCLRCLSQQRDRPKLLCTDCEETNHEQEECFDFTEAHVSEAEGIVDESVAENNDENLLIPVEETDVNVINPASNESLDLEQDIQLNIFPESPTACMSSNPEQPEQDNQLNTFPESSTTGNGYSADLDLAIEKGHTIKVRWSTLRISGPSGSGKSSLIKLLLGKEPLLTHTSTSVLGTIESHGVALLLIADDINCTWEEIQDIKGLLCEAVRSGAVTPSPIGGGRFDFSSNETLPHSFSYVSHYEVSSKAITSPVSLIVEDMRCLLQKQIVSHFVNAPPTYHFVSIIDTGGHEAFFDIAPALHCYGLANIVTHKLDEILSAKAFGFYCVKDEVMGEIKERQLTNQQYLVSSVRSSTSINPPQISGLKTQLQKFQSQIIVGTFSAEINQIETLMTKNSILRANTINCEHVVSYDGKNLIFPINATARDDHDSQIATKIRKHACESYIEADIPLKWFVFLLHLQELCIGLCILKKADCIEIGSSLQMTENEVEAALLYFRDIKMILYWPDALPTQIVFLQPQYLYNKITQLVLASFPNSHEYFENKGIKLHPVAYAEYRDKGIFSLELLHSICGPFDNEDFTSMELLQLLKNLAVIVEIPNFYGDGIHFFPSILPVLPTDSDYFEILQKKYMEELEPLILSWPTGINPQGLFPALIVKLLNDSQPCLFKLKECQQYRNAIQLECVAYRGSVLLVDAVYNVEVFYDSERRSKFDKWISSHVRESIFDGIRSIVNQFHYNDRLANPVKKFVCLKHSEYTKHYCVIIDKNRLLCERDQSGMDISEFKQNPWLQETNLDIRNLDYLLRLLKEFTIHWNRLGLALGLTQGTLDIIDHDCRSRSEDCFRICLQKWLQKADNFHTVTWVSLAEALIPVNDITAPPTGWVNQF